MGKQKSEKAILSSIRHANIQDKKDVRIIDDCNHFLGKNLEGRVSLYCAKCNRFVHVDK